MNFNALNGTETKKFILSRVEKVLDDSGEFSAHITYPWFRFEFSLKLTQLSGMPENPGTAGETKVETKGDTGLPPVSESVELVEFQGAGEVAVPDEARTVSDQPILVEAETETGVKVDKPRRVVGKPAPWLAEGGDND